MQIQLPCGRTCEIDDADFEMIGGIKWRSMIKPPSKTPYVVGKVGKKLESIHRLILRAPANMQVDHIDGNGLNNTRANLRLCTKSQNMANVGPLKNNTSGYRGVHRTKKGLWRADITVQGKHINLGSRKDQMKAVELYDRAALLHFGEFAKTNLPKEAYSKTVGLTPAPTLGLAPTGVGTA